MPIYRQFLIRDPDHPEAKPKFFSGWLRAAGPVMPIRIEPPGTLTAQLQQAGITLPPPMSGLALIDTGASVTGVEEDALNALCLKPIGLASVGTAGGPAQRQVFAARLAFPDSPLNPVDFSSVIAVDLKDQIILGRPGERLLALLGRDLLQHWVMTYDGQMGLLTVAI